jgi:hypothetical protein
VFDKVTDEIGEVVLAAASEVVIMMTVPFTVLVIPWPDTVVLVGLVITEVRVKVTFVAVPAEELGDAAVSEADESEAVVDKVEFADVESEEVN